MRSQHSQRRVAPHPLDTASPRKAEPRQQNHRQDLASPQVLQQTCSALIYCFCFAQTQSFLSPPALCNHISALLMLSKVFKRGWKGWGLRLHTCLFALVSFLQLHIRQASCVVLDCTYFNQKCKSKYVEREKEKKQKNAKLLSLCTSASQFCSGFKNADSRCGSQSLLQ